MKAQNALKVAAAALIGISFIILNPSKEKSRCIFPLRANLICWFEGPAFFVRFVETIIAMAQSNSRDKSVEKLRNYSPYPDSDALNATSIYTESVLISTMKPLATSSQPTALGARENALVNEMEHEYDIQRPPTPSKVFAQFTNEDISSAQNEPSMINRRLTSIESSQTEWPYLRSTPLYAAVVSFASYVWNNMLTWLQSFGFSRTTSAKNDVNDNDWVNQWAWISDDFLFIAGDSSSSAINKGNKEQASTSSQSLRPGSPTSAPGSPTFAPGSPTSAPGSPTSAPGSPTFAPGSPTITPGTPTAAPSSPNAFSKQVSYIIEPYSSHHIEFFQEPYLVFYCMFLSSYPSSYFPGRMQPKQSTNPSASYLPSRIKPMQSTSPSVSYLPSRIKPMQSTSPSASYLSTRIKPMQSTSPSAAYLSSPIKGVQSTSPSASYLPSRIKPMQSTSPSASYLSSRIKPMQSTSPSASYLSSRIKAVQSTSPSVSYLSSPIKPMQSTSPSASYLPSRIKPMQSTSPSAAYLSSPIKGVQSTSPSASYLPSRIKPVQSTSQSASYLPSRIKPMQSTSPSASYLSSPIKPMQSTSPSASYLSSRIKPMQSTSQSASYLPSREKTVQSTSPSAPYYSSLTAASLSRPRSSELLILSQSTFNSYIGHHNGVLYSHYNYHLFSIQSNPVYLSSSAAPQAFSTELHSPRPSTSNPYIDHEHHRHHTSQSRRFSNNQSHVMNSYYSHALLLYPQPRQPSCYSTYQNYVERTTMKLIYSTLYSRYYSSSPQQATVSQGQSMMEYCLRLSRLNCFSPLERISFHAYQSLTPPRAAPQKTAFSTDISLSSYVPPFSKPTHPLSAHRTPSAQPISIPPSTPPPTLSEEEPPKRTSLKLSINPSISTSCQLSACLPSGHLSQQQSYSFPSQSLSHQSTTKLKSYPQASRQPHMQSSALSSYTQLSVLTPSTAEPASPLPSSTRPKIPSSQPSLRPSAQPSSAASLAAATASPMTMFPITATAPPQSSQSAMPSTAVIVTFTVLQPLQGVTASQWNSQPSTAAAFTATVASTMAGIKRSDIAILSVQDGQSSRQRLRRVLLSSALLVEYSVSFNPLALGYADASAAYGSLSSQLTNSINSGDFTASLQRSAAAMGASALASVTALPADISKPTIIQQSPQPSAGPSSHPSLQSLLQPSLQPTVVPTARSSLLTSQPVVKSAQRASGATAGLSIGAFTGICVGAFLALSCCCALIIYARSCVVSSHRNDSHNAVEVSSAVDAALVDEERDDGLWNDNFTPVGLRQSTLSGAERLESMQLAAEIVDRSRRRSSSKSSRSISSSEIESPPQYDEVSAVGIALEERLIEPVAAEQVTGTRGALVVSAYTASRSQKMRSAQSDRAGGTAAATAATAAAVERPGASGKKAVAKTTSRTRMMGARLVALSDAALAALENAAGSVGSSGGTGNEQPTQPVESGLGFAGGGDSVQGSVLDDAMEEGSCSSEGLASAHASVAPFAIEMEIMEHDHNVRHPLPRQPRPDVIGRLNLSLPLKPRKKKIPQHLDSLEGSEDSKSSGRSSPLSPLAFPAFALAVGDPEREFTAGNPMLASLGSEESRQSQSRDRRKL